MRKGVVVMGGLSRDVLLVAERALIDFVNSSACVVERELAVDALVKVRAALDEVPDEGDVLMAWLCEPGV
jgi:hypothetical protein